MGPYYDSIYLMVRQLPEPPEHQFKADATESTAPLISSEGAAKAALSWARTSLLAELIRVLKQPVRRTSAVD